MRHRPTHVAGQGHGGGLQVEGGDGLATLGSEDDGRVEDHVVVEQLVEPAGEFALQVAVPLLDHVLDHRSPPSVGATRWRPWARRYRTGPTSPRPPAARPIRAARYGVDDRLPATEEGRWPSRSRSSTTWCWATSPTWWPTSAPRAAPASSTGATPAPAADAREFTKVDIADRGRGAGVHDRGLRRPRRARALRGRPWSTATAPACGPTSINVEPDPEHVTLGHEGPPGHRVGRHRRRAAPRPSASASNP